MKLTTKLLLFYLILIVNYNTSAQSLTINRVAGPIILNEPFFDSLHQLNLNRGLFADVIVRGNAVWTTYQIAPDTTLSYGKSVWYKKFDRDLNMLQGQSIGINVFSDSLYDEDLGDHQITMMNDKLYIVALIKGQPKAAVMIYDTLFARIAGPVYVGDTATDQFLDMGIGNDGANIYTQFYHVPDTCTTPDCWAAKIYKLDATLNVIDSGVVEPESGSFVTGTSILYVPNGEMGVTQDQLQIFSTNRDYGNNLTIGIHTFAADPGLQYINGSTQTIIQEDRDTYWPCGVSWNQKHQLWIVGYTKEIVPDTFFTEEVGPSFLKVFDPTWNLVDSFALNLGQYAFRVMTETLDDDIYIVYDEMNKSGTSSASSCKIEHYKISAATSIHNNFEHSNNIQIYPNPSTGKYYIDGIKGNAEILVYDFNGRLVTSFNTQSSLTFELTANGVYFVKIYTGDEVFTKKIFRNQ